jgi:hypothetical protein
MDCAHYFPVSSLVQREENSTDDFATSDDLTTRRAYSEFLRVMGEPSLSCGVGTSEAYRFLWLRTFNSPIGIRVEKAGDSAYISAVKLSGAGGFLPGTISHKSTRLLSSAEWIRITHAVRSASFWSIASTERSNGLDGANWVLEGRNNANYHVAERWSPKPGPFRELCLLLVELSKIPVAENDVY